MARAKRKRKGPPLQWRYTLVQDPTGKYYLVNKTEIIKVANQQQVKDVLGDIDWLMTDVIQKQRHMGAGSGVHIQISEIFPP